MQFRLISLNQTPTVTMAHRYQTSNYRANLRSMHNFVEITSIERGRVLQKSDSTPQIYDEGGILILPRTREFHLWSDAPLHCHFTFGFQCESDPVPLSDKEVATWKPQDGFALLPEFVVPGKTADEVQKAIKRIIHAYTSVDFGRFMEIRSNLYRVLALLTEYSVSVVTESGLHAELQNQLYCRRAVRYLSEHISEKIYAEEVAAYTGVSYGYLSRIFRACMGMTLVEYCNQAKIQRVRELISTQKIPLESAGIAVGIEDVKYLSRLFKKYSGITSVEYRELYHAPRKQGKMNPPESKPLPQQNKKGTFE